MAGTDKPRVLALVKKRGALTTRERVESGIHRHILTRLVREGELERVARVECRPRGA